MTLADYLVIAISPALVMAMVGSLVFFLVEVFYQGQDEGRLRFVLAMFVAAAVLIGRISIELGTERATVYAMPLAVATALAINRFVVTQGGPMGSLGLVGNLALLGLIWWAAHKLVWDCTFIDESRDSTGQGLLQAAGLQTSGSGGSAAEDEGLLEPPAEDERPELADPHRAADRRTPWWSPRSRAAQAHPPGVWIVYFALAAVPIFGLGQALIPAADTARRAYGFGLLVTYAASTLGLLLLTSFLGLRRYLRQRWLKMPARMAATWVATGTALIVGVLALALLLPRPAAEFSWDHLATRIGRWGQAASPVALGREADKDSRPDRARVTQDTGSDGAVREHGKASEGRGRPAAAPPSDRPPTPAPAKHTAQAAGAEAAFRRATSQAKAGTGPPDRVDQAAKSMTREPGTAAEPLAQPAPDGSAKTPVAASGSPGSPPGHRAGPQQAGTAASAQPPPDPPGSPKAPSQPLRAEGESPSATPPNTGPASASRPFGRTWPELLAGGLLVLKWVFYAAIAAAGVIAAVRHGREIAAELARLFAGWRAWWAALFGVRTARVPQAPPDGPVAPTPTLPSLAHYGDPFLSGLAKSMKPDELVRYSFEALEAWARQQGCPRHPQQTPAEFALEVGRTDPALASEARALARLYGRAAYAASTLAPHDVEPLGRLWQRLRSTGTPIVDHGPQTSPP